MSCVTDQTIDRHQDRKPDISACFDDGHAILGQTHRPQVHKDVPGKTRSVWEGSSLRSVLTSSGLAWWSSIVTPFLAIDVRTWHAAPPGSADSITSHPLMFRCTSNVCYLQCLREPARCCLCLIHNESRHRFKDVVLHHGENGLLCRHARHTRQAACSNPTHEPMLQLKPNRLKMCVREINPNPNPQTQPPSACLTTDRP